MEQGAVGLTQKYAIPRDPKFLLEFFKIELSVTKRVAGLPLNAVVEG